MKWALCSCVNNEAVLRNTLLASGEHFRAAAFVPLRGYRSASEAYNVALSECELDIMVFVHQDVYLPRGSSEALSHWTRRVASMDRDWGVCGVVGRTRSGNSAGCAYSTGLDRFVGRPFQEPIEVRTLDEIVLVIRRSSGLRFDEGLRGFHLYGTDICLEAEKRGMRNYVIPCYVLHNSNGIRWLPADFWRAYLYLRRKWWTRLPVVTPCTRITKGCTPIIRDILRRAWNTLNGTGRVGVRVEDPASVWEKCSRALQSG
jgi:hypothetical protein